jgi:hypothetical protein
VGPKYDERAILARVSSLKLPEPIRAWLVDRIERVWPEPAPVVATIPQAFEAGRVQRLAGGGPFGLLFDGRLDEVDGRLALEVLENSRMSGEVYFRVWEDGTVESLEPAPRIGFGYASGAEKDAAEQAYFAHNRVAYEHLRERGFLQ